MKRYMIVMNTLANCYEFMRISKASDEGFEHDYSELIGETEKVLKGAENESEIDT